MFDDYGRQLLKSGIIDAKTGNRGAPAATWIAPSISAAIMMCWPKPGSG